MDPKAPRVKGVGRGPASGVTVPRKGRVIRPGMNQRRHPITMGRSGPSHSAKTQSMTSPQPATSPPALSSPNTAPRAGPAPMLAARDAGRQGESVPWQQFYSPARPELGRLLWRRWRLSSRRGMGLVYPQAIKIIMNALALPDDRAEAKRRSRSRRWGFWPCSRCRVCSRRCALVSLTSRASAWWQAAPRSLPPSSAKGRLLR